MNYYSSNYPSFVRKGFLPFIITVTGIFTSIACRGSDGPADLVLRNGRIVTMDDQWPQVSALAVKGDRITAVGTDREMRRYTGEKTKVIDLKGMLAIPGFIEGHGHFYSLRASLKE